MRVLMVSDVYFPRVNGVSTAIQTYRNALSTCGVEVRVIAPDYGNGCDDDWVIRVPSRAVPRDPEDRLVKWRAMQDAVTTAVNEGCDLVHIQTPFIAHYTGQAAARSRKIPVMATYHTLFEDYLQYYAPFLPSSWLRGMARRFSRSQCNALDAIIVPSRAIHDRLVQYGVKTSMDVLPTGIPLANFSPGNREQFRAEQGIAAVRPVALYVGRVAHEKNINFLIDVAARARKQMPEFLLIVAGEGPALSALKQMVQGLGLDYNVMFVGYLERTSRLLDCYSAADVFVFASRTETQGLVLLEAMAMGLPVVALGVMGTVDILTTASGACVPDDDPQVFADAVIALLGDTSRRKRISNQGREYVATWSDAVLAARMATLYQRVIARQ